ncbi:nucleoside deaminase [Zhihengliuella salsuginis]|uniref:tRNA-specific adenosine deaminase n=1 Tax=Zhihengliuella salsuginis TaxID=578222 RepID=A0ABQ3GLJ6_9MICC|nr:nucleoside deaminase [Zhihengliuella salsuginis]GHD12392.1 tRNA-specific adenosine deaminase [Zhihengliuella salsuginis]
MNSATAAASFLRTALELATSNVLNHGGPFGAVVVTADGRVFEGVNRVTATNDPTAHAEITAIRAACAARETFHLTGATLYTSCEPCPMCLGAALWARVDQVFYAADRHDAASVGFDDAAFYEYFENPGRNSVLPARKLALPPAGSPDILQPFTTWNELETRIDY